MPHFYTRLQKLHEAENCLMQSKETMLIILTRFCLAIFIILQGDRWKQQGLHKLTLSMRMGCGCGLRRVENVYSHTLTQEKYQNYKYPVCFVTYNRGLYHYRICIALEKEEYRYQFYLILFNKWINRAFLLTIEEVITLILNSLRRYWKQTEIYARNKCTEKRER